MSCIWIHPQAQEKCESKNQTSNGEKDQKVSDKKHIEHILLNSNHDSERIITKIMQFV